MLIFIYTLSLCTVKFISLVCYKEALPDLELMEHTAVLTCFPRKLSLCFCSLPLHWTCLLQSCFYLKTHLRYYLPMKLHSFTWFIHDVLSTFSLIIFLFISLQEYLICFVLITENILLICIPSKWICLLSLYNKQGLLESKWLKFENSTRKL